MERSIRDAVLSLESDPVKIDLSTVANELIKNVELFPFNESVGFMAGLIPPTTDSVSWFLHKDGNGYAVIHTLFGTEAKDLYEKKIREQSWTASLSSITHKRQPIRDYIARNHLSEEFVYCIMDCD